MNAVEGAASATSTTHDDPFMDVMHEMDRIHGDEVPAKIVFEDVEGLDFHDSYYNADTPDPSSKVSPSSTTPPPTSSRTRRCSSNSNKSSASLDSAIGDISWTHTPKTSSDSDLSPSKSLDSSFPASDTQRGMTSASKFTDALFPSSKPDELTTQQQMPPNLQLLEILQRSYLPSNNSGSHSNEVLPSEVKLACNYLDTNFGLSLRLMPRMPKVTSDSDELLVAVGLLSDSMSRLRHFLLNLEPSLWLCESDRWKLYSRHVCAVALVKASMWVDLLTAPSAFPLPVGEFLSESDAVHLILAHDLYNEMRGLLSEFKWLQARAVLTSRGAESWSVWLLVVMITFFTPHKDIEHPEKVVKIHDYYVHKLQVYLFYRLGSPEGTSLLMSLVPLLERVRSFSDRFREFLSDIMSNGFSKEHESVCENIGLIAVLLQTEPVNFK